MKIAVLYIVMVLADAFYVGGAVWLVSERGWSGWTVVGAIVICTITDPSRFVKALEKERG
jgi:hypothetical protein